MDVDDALRFRPHRILVPPFGPACIIAVGVGCADRWRVHQVHHFPDAALDSQSVGRRARRLQDLVHDRAQSPQVHAAKIGMGEDQIVEAVGRLVLLGGVVEVQHVVLK